MPFCENCGAKLAAGDAFCENCGAKQMPETPASSSVFGNATAKTAARTVFCENCGAQLAAGDAFCENCGAKQMPETPASSSAKTFSAKERKLPFDDDSHVNMELFNSFNWSFEWESAAKKALGERELGIILTNLSALASRLGVSETDVKCVISDYIASAKQRGVEYYLLCMDRNSVSFGSAVPNTVEDIVAFLRQVIEVARPKYLFILGNEEIVEVATWENGYDGTRLKYDEDVDSDFAYAVLDTTSPWEGQDFNLNEALRVGRLPTSDGDFNGFRNYFLVAAEGIGSVETIHSFGVTSQSWEEESQFEYEHFRYDSNDVHTSPTMDIDDSRQMLVKDSEDFNLLFFNLHGNSSHKFWHGEAKDSQDNVYDEDKIPNKVISPHVFEEYPIPFFLGVEACYGAKYIGYTTEESILKTAMRNKCLAFLGSSRVALGSSKPHFRCCADILVGEFLKHISCGETAGDAHLLSIRTLIRRSVSDNDILASHDVLTLAEFALYGDPSACTGKNKNTGKIKGVLQKTVGGVPKGLHIPVPDVLKAAKMYLAEVNAEIEAKVDACAAQFMPFSPSDGTHMKSIGFTQKTYQMQNGKLYNKIYLFNSAFGRSLVSVLFDKKGNVRNILLSK